MATFNTPLRYPGGKQRLTPFIKEIMDANCIDGHYVEPYAGGAGVAIELLLSWSVKRIHLNDYNLGVYAFWHSVLNHTEELCRLVFNASLTIEEWKRMRDIVRSPFQNDLLNLGFSIFYMNRCNRSGVFDAGVIGGLSQNGKYKIDARFNRNELIRRIELIAMYRDKISISNLDAEDYIATYLPSLPENTLVYFDPPYYIQGRALYANSYSKSDHIQLSEAIQGQISRKWILSYDGVPEIVDMYKKRRHFIYDLQYSAAKVYKGKEVFIFCDSLNLPARASIKSVDIGLSNLVSHVPEVC